MATPKYIAINGGAGAYTTVLATQWTWRAEILEDFSANAGVGQGLEYLYPDPTTNPANPSWIGIAGSTANPVTATAGFKIGPQTEPIILGEPLPLGGGSSPTIGTGPDNSGGYVIAATPLIMIRSASATATAIRITQFP